MPKTNPTPFVLQQPMDTDGQIATVVISSEVEAHEINDLLMHYLRSKQYTFTPERGDVDE